MRICFISHSAGDGGAERVLLETIETLLGQGIDCKVLLPAQGALCGELERLNVEFCVISFPLWMARGTPSLFSRFKAALSLAKDTFLVAWNVLRWKCDIVYSNSITVCVGALSAGLLHRPHVWHLHEFGMQDQGLSFLFGERWSLQLVNRLSSKCICVSKTLAQHYGEWVDRSKMTVIYPSVHNALQEQWIIAPFPAASRRFRCLIVGALIEGKGQEDAVLAFSHLKKLGVEAELMVVGTGEPAYCQHLQKLVESNNLGNDVTFAGQVKNALPAMRVADVVLVCSRSEAFGRVTIEAMHTGRPIIGARRAATAELIEDGVNGLLYEAGNPQELAAAIKYLYENPARADQLGRSGRSWVDQCLSQDRFGKQILTVLTPLLEAVAI